MKEAASPIATARRAKRLTQAQLALKVGVDNITISRWERREFKPSGEHLLKLAEALGVKPETLLPSRKVK
jgi:transcriptional regulator with XRE-family HTH domain